MKVSVTNGGTSSRCWDLIRFDVFRQQVTDGAQVGQVHYNAGANYRAVVKLVSLKHGIGVWPYVGEGQNSERVFPGALEREVKRTVAKRLWNIVRVTYWWMSLRRLTCHDESPVV